MEVLLQKSSLTLTAIALVPVLAMAFSLTVPVLYPIQHPRRQMHPLAGARTTRLIGKESSSPKQTQGKILYYDLIICERDGREEHK